VTPEADVARRIRDRFQDEGWTLATMESCTGGLVASVVTDEEGAGFLLGGVVAYDAEMKVRWGVPRHVLDEQGVVSAETAVAMAKAAAAAFGADFGIGTTGEAGREPAEADESGIVFVAAARANGEARWREEHFDGDRRAIKRQAAFAALGLLLELASAGTPPAAALHG
jgi:PncC family amidohydrolase